MKRLLTLILVGVLICSSLFMLSACKDDPDPTPPGPSTDETIPLVENGEFQYRIVYSDFANNNVKNLAKALRTGLQAVTGTKVTIVTDWEDKDENADIKEILVGKTNRAASTEAMDGLSDKEYVIRLSGAKIVLAGGADETLALAVNSFLKNQVGYISDSEFTENKTLSIPKTLNILQKMEDPSNMVILIGNHDVTYVDSLRTALSANYSSVTVVDPHEGNFNAADVFDATKNTLIIIAGADTVPNTVRDAIPGYLANKGRILTLGGPAFSNTTYELDGNWYSKEDFLYTSLLRLGSSQRQTIFDTTKADTPSKPYISKDGDSAAPVIAFGNFDLDTASPGTTDSKLQMRFSTSYLRNWDYFTYNFTPTLKNGNTFGFWAKAGDNQTDGMFVELTDKAGSRWTCGVKLSTEWKYYTLTPTNFRWWRDSTATTLTAPDFSQLTKFSMGFALSGYSMGQGAHSICLSHVEVLEAPPVSTTNLTIDGLAPEYEMYPVTNAASFRTYDNQVFVTDRNYTMPEELVSRHPGRQGTGYGKLRANRFIPLVEIQDAKGLHSGYLAWMTLFSSTTNNNGSMEGSVIGGISAVSNDFYNASGIALVGEVVDAMMLPAYLTQGGTTEYTYIASDTESVSAGGAYVDLSRVGSTENVVMDIELYRNGESIKKMDSTVCKLIKQSNDIRQSFYNYDLSSGTPDHVVVTLKIDGRIVDRIEHDIVFWSPKAESDRHYIYKEDGYFKQDGKIINFFGVNYMPSYGVADTATIPNVGTTFEHYIHSAAYDPEVIHDDLLHIKDMGMNAVSVFIHAQGADSNNMLDLIRQCDELGIYVDLSIRSGNSDNRATGDFLYFTKENAEKLIVPQHFSEVDNIIAYDICWERAMGSYAASGDLGRYIYDAQWRQWILDQYGSVEHAEALWGCKAPRNSAGLVVGPDDNTFGNPTDSQAKMIAAYYRFLDDVIADDFNATFTYMRQFDNNHLYSFRMSMSGSPSVSPVNGRYDFQSLAGAVDLMEPEGYALDANSDVSMLQIPFANAYARYTMPDAPVVWKEYGKSSWTGSNFTDNSLSLENTANYYRRVLEYAYKSYTSGMFCWYYAGGFRIGENSDYGILNPDGSDRPCTTVLRQYAPLFISQGERQTTGEKLISIERDEKNPRGIYDMFLKIKDQLANLFNTGKTFDFINSQQTTFGEKFYAEDVVDMAVGGTKTDGAYPLKYVNGMVKDFQTYEKDGKTYARVTVCNTGHAAWEEGTISLVSTASSKAKIAKYTFTEDVDYLENVVIDVEISGTGALELRFAFRNGLEFGYNYKTTIK